MNERGTEENLLSGAKKTEECEREGKRSVGEESRGKGVCKESEEERVWNGGGSFTGRSETEEKRTGK